MDINQLVTDRFNALVEDGKLQEVVDQKLLAMITGVVDDLTRSYGDFGKQMREKLSAVFAVNLDKLDVVSYNTIVMNIIKEQLDANLYKQVEEPIAKELKNYTGNLEKQEWKISEIIQKFISETVIPDEDRMECGEISFHESTSYGSTYYYFDKKPNKSSYECEYKLYTNKADGKVWLFEIAGYRPHRGDLRQSPIHGLIDGFIFKLYANQASIINDAHDVETDWSTYDD